MKRTTNNKNLSLIVKASMKSRKLSSAMFCFFVIISFVLIFLAIGIVAPLGHNIDTKINNHILNRELVAVCSEKVSDEERQSRLEEIRSIPNVEDIYEMPAKLSVTEESGALYDRYDLGWVHKYFTPQLVSGRAFDESETGVALIPATFQDYNASEGVIIEIDGTELVGKILELQDITGTVRKFEVVGSYDTTDPIFTGKEILIPRSELLKFNDEVINNSEDNMSPISADYSYVVVVDNPEKTEAVFTETEKITICYSSKLNVDAESYNTAFAILLGVTIFFVFLTVFGFYIFLKNNISVRTNELALYRAIGYKSRDLFRIILSEHLLLVIGSLAVGIAAACLLTYFAVNPYLSGMFGGTFMSMTVSIDPWLILAVAIGYVLVTLLVCATAVKRSEKIDLTVLLRE